MAQVPRSFAADFAAVTRGWDEPDIDEARAVARQWIEQGEGAAVFECFRALAAEVRP